MMDTKHIVLIGLTATALLTAVVLVEVLPVLAIAFIILLGGLGITYYAGLSRNRIEYIAEQRLLLEFNKKVIGSRELSEVERVINKYAARIVSCENATILLHDGSTKDELEWTELEKIGRWVEEEQTVLLIDEENGCPPDLSMPADVHSLLAIPLLSRPDGYGTLFLLNIKEPGTYTVRQREMLEYLTVQAAAITSRILQFRTQQDYQLDLLKALVQAIERRETGFAGHSERVAEISHLLGVKLGLDAVESQDLYYAALLHDIGKLWGDETDDLETEGPEELNLKDHASRGALILQEIPGLGRVREGILYHHERYDGTGEPQGLLATDIPFAARIIAVADIFDALINLCAEEERLPPEQALQVVKKASGSILDPLVVVVLEEVVKEENSLFQAEKQ